MVKGENSVYSVPPWSYYTTYSFQSFNVFNAVLHVWIRSYLVFPQKCTFAAVLVKAIIPMVLPIESIFFSYTSKLPYFVRIGHCPALLIDDSDRHSPEIIPYCQIILWIFDLIFSVLLSTSYSNYFESLYTSIITDLNNTAQNLCLLQVEMISPLSLYFLLSNTLTCLFL